MRSRPFGLGCQPKGHVNYVEADRQRDGYHGTVTYDRRLSKEDVVSFDLRSVEEKPSKEEQLDELESLFADAKQLVSGTGNFEPDDYFEDESEWRGDADFGL